MKKFDNNPVQLYVGPEEEIIPLLEKNLQMIFCPSAQSSADYNVENCFCLACRQIKQRQHAFLTWIDPKDGYEVKDVDVIFNTIQFALDPGSRFFFVMPRVHTLNLATANKLLKVLEEPPVGYQFLLYTNNIQAVLPTIVSRSIVYRICSEQSSDYQLHQIARLLIHSKRAIDPFEFEAILKKEHLSDTQSFEILNDLLTYTTVQLKNLYAENNLDDEQQENLAYYQRVSECVTNALKHPPQPGSSEIFWKLLFMTFPKR